MKTLEVDTVRIVEEIEYWERFLGENNIHLPLESRLRTLFEILTDREYETERVENERYLVQLEKKIERLETKIQRMVTWARRLINVHTEDHPVSELIPIPSRLHKDNPRDENE